MLSYNSSSCIPYPLSSALLSTVPLYYGGVLYLLEFSFAPPQHGESECNLYGRIGGDSALSKRGWQVGAMKCCESVCLSVCLSVRPSIRPSVRPSIHPSVRPSVCPSVRPSARPSVRLSVCLSVCLCLSVCVRRKLLEYEPRYFVSGTLYIIYSVVISCIPHRAYKVAGGPVAQRIRHLTTDQGIPGSNPGRVVLFEFLFSHPLFF